MQKITVLGDIMCEPALLHSAKQKDGSYDYTSLFAELKPLLGEADYVIGNIETPLISENKEWKYSNEFTIFGAPESFAAAAKDAGLDFALTANNHVFDRGIYGLENTLRVLDELGIAHAGTYKRGTGHNGATYVTVGGTKFAVISYTYNTNYTSKKDPRQKVLAEGELYGTCNLLHSQTEGAYLPGAYPKHWIDKHHCGLNEDNRDRIKKLFGIPVGYPRRDDRMDLESIAPYMEVFCNDIKEAKQNADFVLVCPHVGGQFDTRPGKFSEYVVEKAVEAGADAVLCSHSHVVQKAEMRGNVPCAFCLGNVDMSAKSPIVLTENHPETGIALHLYLEDKKVQKVTFSILKCLEPKDHKMVCWPVDRLHPTLDAAGKQDLEELVKFVYRTVAQKELDGEIIRHEYELF